MLCSLPLVDSTSKVVEYFDVAVVLGLLTAEDLLSSAAALVKVVPVVGVVLIFKFSEELNEGAFVGLSTMYALVCVVMLGEVFTSFGGVVAAVKARDWQKISIKNTLSMTFNTFVQG